jgi:chitin synthase
LFPRSCFLITLLTVDNDDDGFRSFLFFFMASNQNTQAVASGDLVDLVSSSGSATIYPSDDAILAVLQARFRADLPYTRIGSTQIVAVNPYKTLANVNDVSAKDYEERSYKDTSLLMVDSPRPLQPHLYDLAARVYLLMRRSNESQGVITRSVSHSTFPYIFFLTTSRGITGSRKTTSLRLFLNQLLRVSTLSKRELKLAGQTKALSTVLDSFGNAKNAHEPQWLSPRPLPRAPLQRAWSVRWRKSAHIWP